MNKNSIRLRIAGNSRGEQVFKSIIAHPMETGLRQDNKSGKNVPADYIDILSISVDDVMFFEITLGRYVSKNPYLSFMFSEHIIENQLMRVWWLDNYKVETSYEFMVNYSPNGRFGFTGSKKGSEILKLLPQAGPVCKTN